MNTKQRKMQLVTQDKKMHVAAAIASLAKREKANIVHQLFALMHGTHPNTKEKKNLHAVKSHPSKGDVLAQAQTIK